MYFIVSNIYNSLIFPRPGNSSVKQNQNKLILQCFFDKSRCKMLSNYHETTMVDPKQLTKGSTAYICFPSQRCSPCTVAEQAYQISGHIQVTTRIRKTFQKYTKCLNMIFFQVAVIVPETFPDTLCSIWERLLPIGHTTMLQRLF